MKTRDSQSTPAGHPVPAATVHRTWAAPLVQTATRSGAPDLDINQSPRMVAQRRALKAVFGNTIQLQADELESARPGQPSAAPANETGLPDPLKAGLESLSALDLSDVRVHRDSDKPAQLHALAYAQGNDIYLGPGQEEHVPHEAWHVVQQRQGRVRETAQIAGMGVNDDAGLEAEADLMGGRATEPSVGEGRAENRTGLAAGPVGRETAQLVPEIEATDAAMGQHVVNKVTAINQGQSATTGVHYAHNYEQRALAYRQGPVTYAVYKGYADFWRDDYWKGYANPKFFDRIDSMMWRLQPMESAAEGIKSWLAGLTIAECASSLVAIETDTLRAAIGDDKFDTLYSSTPRSLARNGLLVISKFHNTSSVGTYMGGTLEALGNPFDSLGNRGVKKGEWYYFYNHPQYLLKHPGGAFQGENAICMDDTRGAQKWAGFGVNSVTETEMMNTMALAYSAPRTERDYEILLTERAPLIARQKHAFNTYSQLYTSNINQVPIWYRHDMGWFPDSINANDILSAQPSVIDGIPRKGGFVIGGGKSLSAAKVQQARNA